MAYTPHKKLDFNEKTDDSVLKVGDTIEIVEESHKTMGINGFLEVGTKGTLTKRDDDGEWWADFSSNDIPGLNTEACLQTGFVEYKKITP